MGLDELAGYVGLSPAWLSRLLNKQMGVALVSYRNRHCLERVPQRCDHGCAGGQLRQLLPTLSGLSADDRPQPC